MLLSKLPSKFEVHVLESGNISIKGSIGLHTRNKFLIIYAGIKHVINLAAREGEAYTFIMTCKMTINRRLE